MLNRLTFDSKIHAYKLDGKPITGCTTILQAIAKPALIQWAANQATDYICENIQKLILGTKEEQEQLLKEARKAHLRKRDKAGDVGTFAHKQIERWIKKEKLEPMDKQVADMVANFIEWATKDKVSFISSEKQVYSEKYWFCGTFDFLCEIDNKLFIGDIKTSSNIYPEHFVQCAGYQICEEEMNQDLKINGHIVVNLTKDGKIKTKTNYDSVGYKKLFLSALVLYRGLFQKND